MKVDVITMQAINNYGSVLQTFATQEFFRQHGCDVRIINYLQLSSSNTLRLFLSTVKRSIRYIPVQILFRLLLRAKFSKAFDSFRRDFLNISEGKQYHTMNDFEGYESDADAFCTGSDQVWNSWWSGGILPEFYLAFISDDKYKFAFSASFGKDRIDTQEVRFTQKYIDAYRYISVREDSALKILKEQYNYSRGFHILDPTLCLDADTWRSYVKLYKWMEGGGGQYIFVYNAYGADKNFERYAEILSRKTGLKLVKLYTSSKDAFKNIFSSNDKIIPDNVFDFISLIDNARYVLTDSFHGTAFSLNLNTEPICIYPQRFSNRIESILRLTHTLHRHAESYDDFDIINRPVNWEEVNSILDGERRKASEWLKMVFADIQRHNA